MIQLPVQPLVLVDRYFGVDQWLFDIAKKEQNLPDNTSCKPLYTAVAGHSNPDKATEETVVGILTLASLWTFFDTQYIGKPVPVTEHKDSLVFDRNIWTILKL